MEESAFAFFFSDMGDKMAVAIPVADLEGHVGLTAAAVEVVGADVHKLAYSKYYSDRAIAAILACQKVRTEIQREHPELIV